MTVKQEKNRKYYPSVRVILLPTVLSDTDFIYSTKKSENKDVECIFCNGKFSEDEQGEIWMKCFSWTLQVQRTESISMTFINRLETKMVFA